VVKFEGNDVDENTVPFELIVVPFIFVSFWFTLLIISVRLVEKLSIWSISIIFRSCLISSFLLFKSAIKTSIVFEDSIPLSALTIFFQVFVNEPWSSNISCCSFNVSFVFEIVFDKSINFSDNLKASTAPTSEP
jgi:hypothetical protein